MIMIVVIMLLASLCGPYACAIRLVCVPSTDYVTSNAVVVVVVFVVVFCLLLICLFVDVAGCTSEQKNTMDNVFNAVTRLLAHLNHRVHFA